MSRFGHLLPSQSGCGVHRADSDVRFKPVQRLNNARRDCSHIVNGPFAPRPFRASRHAAAIYRPTRQDAANRTREGAGQCSTRSRACITSPRWPRMPRQNNDFFTHKLGLRRVKKTVNFDAPDVYHLYYGDEVGTPGSVMTYFPFPNIGKGRHGRRRGRHDGLLGAGGLARLLGERLAEQGVAGLKRGDQLRREPAALRRPGRRQLCAGRGQGRRACTLDAWRRAGRRGDPRLPFGLAAG